MKSRTLVRLPTQLFIGQRPDEPRFDPPRNDPRRVWKPAGGLWTSTWREPQRTSAWVEWCRGEQFLHHEETHGWLLEPAPARVYVVAGEPELAALLERYPMGVPWESGFLSELDGYLDFEAFAAEWDALHVPEPVVWALHLRLLFLYGWDSESTWWNRWRFSGRARCVELAEALEAL